MSKAVTSGQARNLAGSFIVDTPWDEIQGDQQTTQDFLELPPAERGRCFAAFVANGFRLIIVEPKTIKLDNSKKFDPAECISDGWTIWKGSADSNGLEGDEDIDERSLGLSEVDLSKVILGTCLKGKEYSIVGEEKLKRLKALKQTIRLGGNVFLALWEDYHANKENSFLEWLRKNRGVTYVDLFGLVLRDPHGNRHVLYLCFDGNKWNWSYDVLSSQWKAEHVSLGVAI